MKKCFDFMVCSLLILGSSLGLSSCSHSDHYELTENSRGVLPIDFCDKYIKDVADVVGIASYDNVLRSWYVVADDGECYLIYHFDQKKDNPILSIWEEDHSYKIRFSGKVYSVLANTAYYNLRAIYALKMSEMTITMLK